MATRHTNNYVSYLKKEEKGEISTDGMLSITVKSTDPLLIGDLMHWLAEREPRGNTITKITVGNK